MLESKTKHLSEQFSIIKIILWVYCIFLYTNKKNQNVKSMLAYYALLTAGASDVVRAVDNKKKLEKKAIEFRSPYNRSNGGIVSGVDDSGGGGGRGKFFYSFGAQRVEGAFIVHLRTHAFSSYLIELNNGSNSLGRVSCPGLLFSCASDGQAVLKPMRKT